MGKTIISIPFDNEIAEDAAFLKRLYNLSLPDAAIAAIALKHCLPLITRDRQLKKVREIIIVEI